MIVLDTNVLSALMRAQPEPVVVDWLDRQSADSIWITAITLFETCLGLSLLEGLTVPVVNPWKDPEPKAPGDLA